MSHTNIIDKDPFFEIDAVTREIINPTSSKKVISQFDHRCEKFSFRINRYVEGHDMTECNKVYVHFTNTDASTLLDTKGVYKVTDLQVDPKDDTKVIFTWLLEISATQKAGKLGFSVEFSCVEQDGTVTYSLNTSNFKGLIVSPSSHNTEEVIEPYVDILEKWKQEILEELNNGGGGSGGGTSLTDEQLENIEAVPKKADKNEVANALKGTVTGSKLTITDLSPLVDELKVKVTQSYIETPYIYKRVSDNLWTGNIKYNDDTSEYDTDLFQCKSGELYDIAEPVPSATSVNVTFYDRNKQVIQASVSVNMLIDILEIPENCHYFKIHKALSGTTGYNFQYYTTLHRCEKYTAENGIITIPAPFDPNVYLYLKNDYSQFECEYNKDINKVLEGDWELISSDTLTKEVSSLTLDGFSCSKVMLKMTVYGSSNNTSDNAPLAVWVNSTTNSYIVKNSTLVNIIRNTNGGNNLPYIFLELKNKSIVGQLFGTGTTSYGYLNREENETIKSIFLKPDVSGVVIGANTTYELWGVRK